MGVGAAQRHDLLAGTSLRLLEPLDHGAAGAVWVAFDTARNMHVAVKQLTRFTPVELARFKREFRVLAGLTHPNVVMHHELLEVDGKWFLSMELVRGTDLLRHVRAGVENDPGFSEARLRFALRQLARGLHAVHRAGLLHLDIKPANVRVAEDGRVVLLDFGLVRTLEEEAQVERREIVAGSAAYMAPEQAAGLPVGPAADWYAVGVVLYEALTGTPPFGGEALQVMLAKQSRRPMPPSALVAGVPDDLERLCMGLLDPDPRLRLPGEAVVEALWARAARSSRSRALAPSCGAPFVGRTQELARLRAALDAVTCGRPQTVLIEGESGIGKSALVEAFLREVSLERPHAWLVRGRCFEREAVPFKAFDGVMDGLAELLEALPEDDCAALLPPDAASLLRPFPVLGRVAALARAPAVALSADPTAARGEALHALSALLQAASLQRPLVLAVDDMQWSDQESFRVIEALRAAGVPLMLLLTARPLRGLTGPVGDSLRALADEDDVTAMALSGLDPAATRALVRAVAGARAGAEDVRAAIEESEGSPLFAWELGQYLATRGRVRDGRFSLEAAILRRVERAPVEERALLDMVAVAGSPRPLALIAEALDMAPARASQLAGALAGRRLLHLGRDGSLQCFHDRVRAAVASRVDPAQAGWLHERLAAAFERRGDGESADVAAEWLRAGRPERALPHLVTGGDRALMALAFEQAAELYGHALALAPGRLSGHARADLARRCGEALARGGRSAAAAAAFLEALDGARDAAENVHLRRLAAQHLLQAGRVAEGMALARELLKELGVPMAGSSRAALLKVLWLRGRLRSRLTQRRDEQPELASSSHNGELEPRALRALDALDALSTVISWLDVFVGAELGVRHTQLALETGAPYHLVRALSLEAVQLAFQAPQVPAAAEHLFARALQAARRVDDPKVTAYLKVAQGMFEMFHMRPGRALPLLEEAEQVYRGVADVHWLQTPNRSMILALLLQHVRIERFVSRAEQWSTQARERDDRVAWADHVLTGQAYLRHMVADRPQEMLAEVQDASALWEGSALPGLPQVGRYYAEVAYTQYADRDASAGVTAPLFRRLVRSPLGRLAHLRAELYFLRAWSCLGSSHGVRGRARAKLLSEAAQLAGRMARVHVPHRAHAVYVRGLVALMEGRPESAAPLLDDAVQALSAQGNALMVEPARLALRYCESDRAGAAHRQLLLDRLADLGFGDPRPALLWLCPFCAP